MIVKCFYITTLFALGLYLHNPCYAAEPDFLLLFKECSSIVGYLNKPDASLKKFEFKGSVYACNRYSRKFRCHITFEDGGNPIIGNNLEYELIFEAGGNFDMRLPTHGDYISVNTASRVAVLVTRVASEIFLGSKVCLGTYMTADEANYILKDVPRSK